jgi:hypothetical protein
MYLLVSRSRAYPAYNVPHGQENRNEQLIPLDLNDYFVGARCLDIL